MEKKQKQLNKLTSFLWNLYEFSRVVLKYLACRHFELLARNKVMNV